MLLTKEDQQAIIKILDNKIEPMNERLDFMNERLGSMNERLDSFEEKTNNQFAKLNERLSIVELREEMTHKKLDNLSLDVKVLERDLRKDIHLLQDAQDTLIEILENNGTLPLVK